METANEHAVALWANIPLTEVDELGFVEYRQYLRDALISGAQSTEQGREYLDNAWLLEQTEPDRDASRKLFKR